MERQGPKWATPNRQAELVNLFAKGGGFCVHGHKPCPIPAHHYENFIEGLIGDWKADDRAIREADWRELSRWFHGLGETGRLRGRFNAVSRDIYFGGQPEYYLIGLGISGLTYKPFAQVRIASSLVNLYVDLGNAMKGISKARKRKAIRYGKPLPQVIAERIDGLIRQAVKDYQTH